MSDPYALTRRQLAGLGAGGGVAAALAAVTQTGIRSSIPELPEASASKPDTSDPLLEPFHGVHQGGIATALQRHARLIGLDLHPDADRDAVRKLLSLLTDDASRLTQAQPALGDTEPELAMKPARLTITAGFGPRLFDVIDRARWRPLSVKPLPAFAHDRLDAAWGQTDLLLQVAGDDELVVEHATRMLIKDSTAFATVPWVQQGFTAPATPHGTPRNLLGQVDGTVNPQPGTSTFDRSVWAESPSWFAGGTVMVLRRIRFDLESWDAFEREGKEFVTGRRLSDGSPLTGGGELAPVDLMARDEHGFEIVDPTSHVAQAHPRHAGETMLRRSFSYHAGYDPRGRADAGLLFIAFQSDADAAFVAVQKRLAASDLLHQWLTHIGSAVYAVPPGVAAGEHWGAALWR